MLPEPAVLKIVRLDGQAGGDMLGHAVQPFALLCREGFFCVVLHQPDLIPLAHFLGVGKQGKFWSQRVTHERDEVGKLGAAKTLDLVALHGLKGAPKLNRRCGERRRGNGGRQLAEVFEREFQRLGAGIDYLQRGEFVLVRGNPDPEIFHLGLRLGHRAGIKAGIQDFINGVAVNGLLVLRPDFEDAAAERGLVERRDGGLRELLGSLLDVRLGGFADDAG